MSVFDRWHGFFLSTVMLQQEFMLCLISGNWRLRGHVYRFLTPALRNNGYFIVDGVSDTQFNFEVSFENGLLYLYLNVDNDIFPGERYRVLYNYSDDRITMIHEILKADESGYELPTEVVFEKVVFEKIVAKPPQPVKSKTWAYSLGEMLHGFVRKLQISNC